MNADSRVMRPQEPCGPQAEWTEWIMAPNSRWNAAEAEARSWRGHPLRTRAPDERDSMAAQIDILTERLNRLKTSTAAREHAAEPEVRPGRGLPQDRGAPRETAREHARTAESCQSDAADGPQARLRRIEACLADLSRRLDDGRPDRRESRPVEQDLRQAIREIASGRRAPREGGRAPAPMRGRR